MTELELNFKNHKLIVRSYKNVPTGIVFDRNGSRLAIIQEKSFETALEKSKEFVSNHINEARLQAQKERDGRPASTDDYIQAFQALMEMNSLKSYHKTMLRAHCRARDQILSMSELAKSVNNSYDFQYANVRYGWLGGEIASILGLDLEKRKDGSDILHLGIANSINYSTGKDEQIEDAEYKIQMKSEVLKALEILNLA